MPSWFTNLKDLPRNVRGVFRKREDYRAVFEGDAGERVLADLAAFCHAGEPVHVPGDPYTTAFNDGKRRVLLRIKSFINMSDEHLMLRTQQEAESYDED